MIELNSNDGQHSFDQQYCQPTAVSQAKGLLNMIGQNNCFLNSAVQVGVRKKTVFFYLFIWNFKNR